MQKTIIKTIIRLIIFLCQAGTLLAGYIIKALIFIEKQLTFQLDEVFIEKTQPIPSNKNTPHKKRKRHKKVETC